MNKKDILELKENENIEFKEAKTSYSIRGGDKKSKSSVYAYVVGLGNAGGGKLFLGVKNNGEIIGTNALENFGKVKFIDW